MRTLIVVDVQNDFVNGSLGSEEAQAIIPNVKKKIEEYYNRGDQRNFHYTCIKKGNRQCAGSVSRTS